MTRQAHRLPLLFPTTNRLSRNQAMQCINCKSDLNGYPLVCPYCHTDPASFGSQPYSGIDPANRPQADGPTLLLTVLIFFGMIGRFVFPPVGIVLLGLAGILVLS